MKCIDMLYGLFLQKARPKNKDSLSNQKRMTQDLLQKFENLKRANVEMYKMLNDLSDDQKLPPVIPDALAIIAERKNYLDALNEQISSYDESVNNSVFSSSV